MVNKETFTPPQISTIFPFEGNSHLVDDMAIQFGIIAYPEKNILFYSGDIQSSNKLKELLKGGVSA